MCGIAGIYNYKSHHAADETALKQMVSALYHRGPDENGFLLDGRLGMGMSRLSIIDLSHGQQPIHNENQTVWVVFNGEIFNYIELRQDLEKQGHRFYTHSDTEVIVHLYEQYGQDFPKKMIGQFAIALWDKGQEKFILLRDRVGIRPLFFSENEQGIHFGSEAKAIFAAGHLQPRINEQGLADLLTFWSNIPTGNVFEGVSELPPGSMMTIAGGKYTISNYWENRFPENGDFNPAPFSQLKEEMTALLDDAIRLRLRADVPVAAYLSGGIDSSVITSLVKDHHQNELITFSVTFADKNYNEAAYQQMMIDRLGTRHFSVHVDDGDIGRQYIDAIWYGEKALIRTAPAPLLALSELVRRNNIKVVLTGEGADEIFAGYNIFKEQKVRRFWAARPDSAWRGLLLSRLYPYILGANKSLNPFWQAFFKKNLQDTASPWYSHELRWLNTATVQRLFTGAYRNAFQYEAQLERLKPWLPAGFDKFHSLNKAQFLEMYLFLNGYLLSSQGDRMMMGNSVEGRFPFLDHRLIEFMAKVPPRFKLNVLNEKYLLKESFKDQLPAAIIKRDKQPYRAPISRSFLGDSAPELIKQLISPEYVLKYGYFQPKAVEQIRLKALESNFQLPARDEMALTAIVSTQLLHYHFVGNFKSHIFRLGGQTTLVRLS